ncbi:MAG: oligoribonuclease [Chloroflexota bacterium]|nr:oligoribonuclease [Chloroflexota bacterium]
MSDDSANRTAKPSSGNMVWIDLEMTGLDPGRDVIIEAAVLITDSELEIIANGPDIAIRRSEDELSVMNAWNRRTHHQSGLVKRVRASDVTIDAAEEQILEFVREWTIEGMAPLCGNSVHQDRRFLYGEMPKLIDWVSYRIIDVSTVKELATRWYPEMEPFVKQERHRALDDIRESIDELRWYRQQIFKPSC